MITIVVVFLPILNHHLISLVNFYDDLYYIHALAKAYSTENIYMILALQSIGKVLYLIKNFGYAVYVYQID